jgi:hypothetical protein
MLTTECYVYRIHQVGTGSNWSGWDKGDAFTLAYVVFKVA